MNPLALALVVGSAFLHALRDLLIKRSDDKIAFSWLYRAVGLVLILPLVLARGEWTISPVGWALIAGSAVVHALYAVSLAKAYEGGDLSLVYPIARSAPIFVLLWSTLVWQEAISSVGLAGTVLVIIGAYVVQARGLRARDLIAPIRATVRDRSLRWAWATALLVSTYSLIDDRGVAAVDPLPYMFIYGVLACALLAPWVLRSRRAVVLRQARTKPLQVAVAAAISKAGYLMALIALQMEHVGYVAGVRQMSILFGVLLGWRVLREPHARYRLAGAGVMLAGMLIIGLWG